jgi:hypothetical protein
VELLRFAGLRRDHSDAGDKQLVSLLLSRFYSAERLASGRERWVEPDLAPLRLASVRV